MWASADRGAATRQRANEAGLLDLLTVPAVLADATIVLSICPPHAAHAVALEVASHGFSGIYVDANATAPSTVRDIEVVLAESGAQVVDAVIFGTPGPNPDILLEVSGGPVETVRDLFADTSLQVEILQGGVGAASVLKMCAAGWNKGIVALLTALRAMARLEGAEADLLTHWERTEPGLAERSDLATQRAYKAWRFSGEMSEIARAMEESGLPAGFHEAAAEIFARQARFKDREPPSMEDLLTTVSLSDDDSYTREPRRPNRE